MQIFIKCSTILTLLNKLRVRNNLRTSILHNIQARYLSKDGRPRAFLRFSNWLFACMSLSLASVFVATESVAAVVDHVNVGRIIVQDQSLRSQKTAGKKALEQVFIKLSGNTQILAEPEIARAVNNYEQYLVASSFIQQQQDLLFEATFNQQKVESLLLASGLSVWTNLRPSGVLWLAIEDSANEKILITQNTSSNLLASVTQQSFARGVDIIMPLGDFQDATEISVYDVWNQFVSKLQAQNQRYNTDFLISATIQPFNAELADKEKQQIQTFDAQINEQIIETQILDTIGSEKIESEDLDQSDLNNVLTRSLTQSQTVALSDLPVPKGTTHKLDYIITLSDVRLAKRVEAGRIFADSEARALEQLVDIYANMLAKQFALRSQTTAEDKSIVVVNNVDSLNDYIKLLALIKSIPAVSQASLIKQVGTQAYFEVEKSISVSQLKSILSLDARLTIEPTTEPINILFRWQG